MPQEKKLLKGILSKKETIKTVDQKGASLASLCFLFTMMMQFVIRV
jgi:hypothetical protein